MKRDNAFTSNNHHADSKGLFIIRFSSNVAESNTRHACHGVIQSSDVHRASWRSFCQLVCTVVSGTVFEVKMSPRGVGQFPQPTVDKAVFCVASPYAVPDASKPMGHQHVEAQQKNQHGSSIFEISVQFPNDSTQSEQSHHFESTK